jgi:hypothetical protein
MITEGYVMITFVTHDAALMWSRFERMAAVSAAMIIVAGLDWLTSGSFGFFTMLGAFGAQLIVLKCWLDMAMMGSPYENCWSFKG